MLTLMQTARHHPPLRASSAAASMTQTDEEIQKKIGIQGEGRMPPTGSLHGGAVASSTEAAAATATKQLKYRGVVGTLCTISRQEGPRALYNGLNPGLQRQMCFASVRIGLYDSVKQAYMNIFQAKRTDANIGLRILAGVTTGGMAVLCAQPTDVVKVRFQAHTGGVRRYSGVWNAYKTIGKQEGMRGLWKGTSANVARNAVVNATELVSYDLIKGKILSMRLLSDNMPCHFLAAFGAGFCTTVMASPVDVVKTRYMNSAEGVYKGVVHCAVTMFRREGAKAFYKGFWPSFVRLGSWNIVMFVCFEQLKRRISHFSNTVQAPVMPPLQITINPPPSRYI